MKLAFYKGRGRFWDWIVRIVTFSRYSHVEMVFNENTCFSSSPRDGGVRFKAIKFEAGHWDFVDVPSAYIPDVYGLHNKAIARVGLKYDWLGALNAVFPWRLHMKDRWFCSEIIADMLDVENPQKQTPGSLHKLMTGR